MIKGNGRPVYEGVAIGKIFVLSKDHKIENTRCADKEKEIERFKDAREKERAELDDLHME